MSSAVAVHVVPLLHWWVAGFARDLALEPIVYPDLTLSDATISARYSGYADNMSVLATSTTKID